MAIFKKTGVQGNFILTNGNLVLFDARGYYETEKEDEIEQLSAIYEKVDAREEVVVEKAPEAPKATAGAVSSATLKAMAK